MAMSAYLNIPDPRYEISAEEAEKLPATPNNTFLCTACGSPVTLVPHGERHTAYFRGTHHHPDCILARLRLGLSQELSNEEREYLRKNLDLKTTLYDLEHLRFEGGANGGAGNNAQNGRPRISVKKKYAFLRESPIHLSIDFTHHFTICCTIIVVPRLSVLKLSPPSCSSRCQRHWNFLTMTDWR